MNATIVIATCGNDTWRRMGDECLNELSLDVKTVRFHGGSTVSEARNEALKQVTTDYVVFLDADDTLSHDYLDFNPTADVTVTSITYENRTQPIVPKVWQHERMRPKQHMGECEGKCLLDGNYVHVGAIIKTKAIQSIGGFPEYPVYEDWACFLKLYLSGFSFSSRKESVYKASVRVNREHRNRSMPLIKKNKIHEQIYEDLTGEKYENKR